MLKLVAISPHPPVIIPAVGGRDAVKVAATAKAMKELALEIDRINPEILVAITPHGPVFRDAVTILALDSLEGNLERFDAPQIQVEYKLDRKAAEAILKRCQGSRATCSLIDGKTLKKFNLSQRLDHGLVVPLSFLAATNWKGGLVPVNVGLLPYEELYSFGALLKQALDDTKRSWVLLISGDLSHRLTPEAPAGYSKKGAVFDEIIRQCVREGDIKRLINLDPELIEEAGECGMRPLVMGLGTLDGYEIISEELSYEGPFGVGYLVAKLLPGKKSADRELSRVLYDDRMKRQQEILRNQSEPVRLARASIRKYLSQGSYLLVPAEYDKLCTYKAGAFVSLKKQGELRGCIGTIEPVRENLAEEIIRNAVSAAVNDPRFEPLEPEELDELTISVDVLEKPEPVAGIEELDPEMYGVIVTSGHKRGLLLPNLAGVHSSGEQVRIAMNKAGITDKDKYSLERFRVTRYF